MKYMIIILLFFVGCYSGDGFPVVLVDLYLVDLYQNGYAHPGAIIFEGDSNTDCIDICRYTPNGWNIARSGSTITNVMSRAEKAISTNPGVIVLMVGTNDITAMHKPGTSYPAETEQEFYDKYQAVLDSYKTTRARIYCVSILPRAQSDFCIDVNAFIQAVNSKLKELVELNGMTWIDEWHDFYDTHLNTMNPDYCIGDGVHLNSIGMDRHMGNVLNIINNKGE